MALQGEPGDPMWEALWAKGRFEHALLWMVGGLAAGFLPSLFLVDAKALVLEPKLSALAFGMVAFAIPLLSFRGWARDRAGVGIALAGGGMALGAWMTTGKPLVTLLATAVALGGAVKAYRLYNDTEFRPHMMQAAIDTARAQAAQRPQIPQEH